MNAATWNKLARLGYDEKFLESICTYRKDKSKRYELRVTDIEDLDQDPADGIFICYACFNTEEELEEIYTKLEGFAFILKDKLTGEVGDGGIIDEGLFDIMEDKWREVI